MDIHFYWCKSSKEVLYKDIEEIHAVVNGVDTPLSPYNGTLRAESSILEPIFIIQSVDDDNTFSWAHINYFYVPQWDRYYYITDITVVNKGIYRISGKVDVLMSFADEIDKCAGIAQNNEYDWNMYLDDGSCKVYQDGVIEILDFDVAFNTNQFILAVAGTGVVTT